MKKWQFWKRNTEQRSAVSTVSNPLPWLVNLFGGNSKTGITVNETNALSIAAVYRCIEIISNSIALLPKKFFEESIDQNGRRIRKEKLPDIFYLVNDSPDTRVTAFKFWQFIVSSALMHGKGFALIQRDGLGMAVALHYIPNHMVSYVTDPLNNFHTEYYQVQGIEGIVFASDMFLLENFKGLSVLRLHAETLGLSLASRDFGATFYGEGPTGSGLLTSEMTVKPDQRAALAASFKEKMFGSAGNHNVAVLDNGFKWQPLRLSPGDAHMIESLGMTKKDISTIFGVPLPMLGSMEAATWNNIEQLNIQFVQQTVMPWAGRVEEEIKMKLVAVRKKKVYCRFDLAFLLRGDTKSRQEYYRTMQTIGAFNVNDIREAEGKNPVEGGDQHLVQINLAPLDKIGELAEKSIKDKPAVTPVKDVEE